MAQKRGLGKGLDALIPNDYEGKKDSANVATLTDAGTPPVPETLLDITRVEPNRSQPRKNFDEEALEELADSIKLFGLLQPILVQDRQTHFEIVAGERRWRAAKKAGLKEIPVIIKEFSDQEIIEISLIENIQREDLNPIEEAQAFKRLLTEFNLKQEEIAERVSKSRTAVTNSIRLLKLCPEVQQMIVTEMITTGHARALISIEDPSQQFSLAKKIFDEKLNVRDVEKLVKKLSEEKTDPEKANSKVLDEALLLFYQEAADSLKAALGTKVTISAKGNGSGKIEIEFYGHEDFDRLVEQIK
jgi:ParB family chromosome partitioning protein